MITPEEIQSIGLFATLGGDACARISNAAADVALVDGEYAAHEGDDPALFALLDGRIEAVKATDGGDKVVGERLPGHVFGEVPIALGSKFPVSFRAAGPARVLRLEVSDYHEIAARAPEVAQKVGELARHRIEGARGLSGIAADQPKPRVLIVGDKLDPDFSDLRHFLDRNQVSFRWVQAEDPDAQELWDGPLPSASDRPTLRVIDGKTVRRPRLRRVAELLELGTEPRNAEYDVVVVGAGPAGLAAGVYGASEGLTTLVIERQAPGGQAGTSSRIENYLGFPSGVSGDDLAKGALTQARRLGAEILVTRKIEDLDASTKQVYLDDGDVIRARTIILACGVTWRDLPIDGLDRLTGKGVFYGAARSDARHCHGLDVHVVGAGNSAGQAALHFANHAHTVTILCRSDDLGKSMSQYLVDQIARRSNIVVRTGCSVESAHGESSLEAIDIRTSTGVEEHVPTGGVYIFIGADAVTAWLPPEVSLDARGYVLTGPDVASGGRWEQERDPYLLETSVPGVFACGDVRSGSVKRCAAAVGEGSMAIAFVHQFLRERAGARA